MRPSLVRFPVLALFALALPACAGYGPVDPAGGVAPVRASRSATPKRTTRASRPAPAPAASGVVPPMQDSADAPPRDGVTTTASLEGRALLLPVAGIDPGRLHDSFTDGRDGGARQHNALDIMAARGTPVLAADSGRILRLSRSALGGITVFAVDPSERLVYYYAHLDRYQEGIAEGMRIVPGDTLGYVGSTGNASPDAPHLHFQVMRMPADRRRYWDGEPINPFPVLAAAATSRARDVTVTQAGDEREQRSHQR